MSIKDWFDLAYTVLFVVALIIVGWSNSHKDKMAKLEAKSRLVGDAEAVAGAYCHYFEQTELPGNQKMKGVIESGADALKSRGYKIDDSVLNLLEAFAQQYFDQHIKGGAESATVEPLNSEKVDNLSNGTATPVENADEKEVTTPDVL